ncbi:putative MFS transporter [Aspergillus leporis]|uniref:Putative MFS transporter n=1 Tax=Aspergillus leporis TaxID=41062 RepID=A0A5N5WRW6_9EURO|nr:putative MFS transporter [Aspergillus leporis]
MPSVLVSRAGVRSQDQVFWTSIMLVTDMGAAVVSCPVVAYWVDASRSRKIPFLAGVLLQIVAVALFTAAQSTTMYIVERVLQGWSSAIVSIAGLALLRDGMGKQRLGEALGYMELGSTLGVITGPPIGGLVYQKGGYYAVCSLGFVIAVLDLMLRLAVLEKEVPGSRIHNDATSTSHTISERSAESRADVPGFKQQKIPTSLRLLKESRMWITLWGLAFDGIVTGAFDATLPSFAGKLFGWNPFAAGLIFLVIAVPALLEPIFGRLTDRFGARIMAVLGYTFFAPCLISLQFISQNTLTHKVLLAFLVALCSLAPGMAQPGLYIESQMILGKIEDQTPGIFGDKGAVAQAFGLQTMANYAGLAVGPIIGGSLLDRYGWKVMAWVLGAMAGVTVLPMFWLSNETLADEKGRLELREQRECPMQTNPPA